LKEQLDCFCGRVQYQPLRKPGLGREISQLVAGKFVEPLCPTEAEGRVVLSDVRHRGKEIIGGSYCSLPPVGIDQ